MKAKECLTRLTSAYGVSGNEKSVSKYAGEILSNYCDEVRTDNMGNVIGQKSGCGENPRKIMIEAHMDQVGFLVSDIDDDGLILCVAVGGIDVRILPGLRVKILGRETINGVFRVPLDEDEKNAELKSLKVFTGYTKSELEKIVTIGDHIVYDGEITELCNKNFCSPSMDNRSGMTALILALDMLSETELEDDLYIVFSTQEEVGLRGAYTSTYGINPDFAVVVDVTHGTTADSKDDIGVFDLGSGAVILRGPNVDYDMALKLIEISKKHDIDYKIETAGGASGTTAWAIQTVGCGVPVLLISIPLRYMHTNVEVLKMSDITCAAKLVATAVCEL